MTQENEKDHFRNIVDKHLSRFVDGESVDQEHYDSVLESFEDQMLNANRNADFVNVVYNSENRIALEKILGILKRLDDLEFNAAILNLINLEILPYNSEPQKLKDEDKRLIALLYNLILERRKVERLEPVFNKVITQLKTGKTNAEARRIVDECCHAWRLLSGQTPPKYISEYDHPLLKFVQAVLDEVLGRDVASARTYFK